MVYLSKRKFGSTLAHILSSYYLKYAYSAASYKFGYSGVTRYSTFQKISKRRRVSICPLNASVQVTNFYLRTIHRGVLPDFCMLRQTMKAEAFLHFMKSLVTPFKQNITKETKTPKTQANKMTVSGKAKFAV